MMVSEAERDVLNRLQTTINRVALPEKLRASGQALADRLASPVRLSFIGPPGVGKTTLIQALLAVELPVLKANAPTYELAFGDKPRINLTLEDGTREDIENADFAEAFQRDPVFAEIKIPCDHLQSIRMLELVTDGSIEEMRMAVPWASKRCEIPIWCSRVFDQTEARIWAEVPAAQKNHAMLVLTQADMVPSDQMTEMLERAFGMEGTGFCVIAPVAAQHALQAQAAGQENAEKMLKASGIGALRQEIFRRVEQGRQADLDHAEIFLSRFEAPKTRKLTQLRPDIDLASLTSAQSDGLIKGADYLREQAQNMLVDIEEFGPFAPTKIVERCLETANTLIDLIADDAPETEPQYLAHNAASDAADMLLLMTLENTAGAAEDAVKLMLQVKREFDLAA